MLSHARSYIKLLTTFTAILGFGFLPACDDDKDDHGGDHCYSCGPQATAVSIDLSGALGLAILDESGSTSLALQDSSESGNMVKIGTDGEITDAVTRALPEGKTAPDAADELEITMPRIVALGFSPSGDVYALFEYPFIFKVVPPSDHNSDPWSSSSQYTCQLFKSKLKVGEFSTVDPNAATNLTCVTTTHEIPTWDRNQRLMQFDSAGNLYFPARVPGTGREIFYQYDPVAGQLTEKVNANICFRDVEVTPTGSIFYTGSSSGDGSCSGTSFFRYISASNSLIEITRDWWDFKYESEVDPNNPDIERILFYGPDPDTSSGLPSWDSACLYRYDPSVSDATARATRMVQCLNDIWGYVEARDVSGYNQESPSLTVRQTRKTRCEAADQVFIGGSGIDQLEQSTDGRTFVVGELKKKIAGTFQCDVEIVTAHCSSLDPSHTTSGACSSAGYTWKEEGYCSTDNQWNTRSGCEGDGDTWEYYSQWYNGVETNACLVTATASEADNDNGVYYTPYWNVRWVNCQQPSSSGGDGWTTTIKGLAYVDPDSTSGTEKLLALYSTEGESVIRAWLIPDANNTEQVYYTSFSTGQYSLKRVNVSGSTVTQTTILSDYEVYNLSADPADSGRILFDGLKFSTNTYRFGSIDPDASDTESSVEDKSGFTGQIETLMIVPDI